MRPAILIHGPTASGKTALAIRLAQELGGEIVNADAMQVYSDLRTLSARPSDDELACAPHYMFGHVDGATRYSTGQWLREAFEKVCDIRDRGRVPIVVGGTGLYFSSLVKGLSDIPAVPEEIRRKAHALVEDSEARAFEQLAEADPEAASRIQPGDHQRVSRALEVFMATGKPISGFQTPKPPSLKSGEWLGLALTPPREALYARIEARFDAMLSAGAPEEARKLWSRELARDLPVMRAHGMPGFCDYFDGLSTLEAAVVRAKRDTRRYAKRQFTWIAHQLPTWVRVPTEKLDHRAEVVFALYAEAERARINA